ncbi:MAG TPA: SDR family NAD(P)-dependent oxidoreductase [Jatrophihabitans sp.]|nr:SDR family NAD(P)-dependent oxidoreductase [Jatrophihabitans sp.]
MIDALGAPQSMLVLGATSDIAAATVTRLAGTHRLERVVLAARSEDALAAEADRVRASGVSEVVPVRFEARDPDSVGSAVAQAFDGGDIDVVLVAFGVLPDQRRALADPPAAIDTMQVNYVGAAAACLHAAAALRHQGHGALVVLSSVAAERPRRSNFVYGSAKAGLDALATGLGDELRAAGVTVLVVRPGFVYTTMTRGMRAAPFPSTAADVAEAVARGLRGPSRTIWVPGELRPVMSVLRHLPRAVFRRLGR